MFDGTLSASTSFSEAADKFLEDRAAVGQRRFKRISERWHDDMTVHFEMLGKFFGDMRLDEIKPYHLAGYQDARTTPDGVFFTRSVGGKRKGWTEVPTACGPNKTNTELGCLVRMMKAAGAWTPEHELSYIRLEPIYSDIPKALTFEQQERFFEVAASDPEFRVIWWYSIVAEHITFSSDEMRTIRQGDICRGTQVIGVNPGFGKNVYRKREVSITSALCMWALDNLLERSVELVGRGPEKMLFPFCISRGHWDGARPTTWSGLRKPFEVVRDMAGLRFFGINGWRHTSITNLVLRLVPMPIVMARAGHISPRMTRHYTHVWEGAQRAKMLEAEAMKKPPQRALPAPAEAWGSRFVASA